MHVVGNSIMRICSVLQNYIFASSSFFFFFFTVHCNYNLIFPGPFLETWIVRVWLLKIGALELVPEVRNLMEILKIANSRNLVVMELDFKPKFNSVQTNALVFRIMVFYFRSFYWIELFWVI